MKRNLWLVCGTMLWAGLLAQQAANAPVDAPAAAPAAAGNAVEALAKKAPPAAARNPSYELKTTPLVPGPATVVASNVNVRGQARLKGEVIGRITRGQEVFVLEEITLRNSGPDEPSAWAKIVLPAHINAWVNTSYIDPATKTVRPRRLNLRGGPGENYSIIGRLQRGEAVSEVRTKDDWTAIEAPTNAYAFVAAQYLKQEPAAPPAVAATEPPPVTTTEPPPATATVPPPETATVTEPPAIATTTTELPAATNPVTDTAPAASIAAAPAETADATNEVPATAEAEEPPQPRIVQREGVVRGTLSIQAPTKFELYSPESGRVINYLYTSSRELDLRRYKGLRIIVTGEEALDERWRNTPVVTIQRIQVLD